MKKILIAAGALVVLAGGAIVVLPSLVPAERIKQEVVAQVKAATGRDLSIQGKVAVSAFPSLSVQVANVALSNPPGFQSKELLRLGALDVRLKLLPILSGKVEIDSFVLVDPMVTLEVDRHGKANWVFDSGKPEPKAEAAKGGGGGGIGDLSLGQVRIENGKLSYFDGVSGNREEIDAINLAVDLKNLDSPLAAKGGLKWRGKAVDLALGLVKPRAVMDGASSPLTISVATDAIKLAFTGEATGGKAAGIKGDVDLGVPSVRGLAQWATGKAPDLPGTGFGPLAIKANVTAGGTKVALDKLVLSLDALKAQGALAVDTVGARPAIKGRLEVEALDLNPYLPAEQPAKTPPKQASSEWSEEPMDASGLKAVDADLSLSAGSITIRKIKLGKSALHVALAGGRLNADLSELELYKGAGKGRVMVDGSSPGVGLDAAFNLKGLAAGPFLEDAAGFDRLDGTGNAEFQVAGKGKSQKALVSSLNGTGAFTFLDGSIKGINLAEMARNIGTAFTSSGTQKTDFAELSGTFTITDGIVANKDLSLRSPLLRVEGAGTVEMPKRTQHYRIEPKLVASLEGQGGKSDLGGVSVPVMVEGSWDSPTFRPDLGAMAKGQAGQAIQNAVGDKLPSGPMSLFGR